MPTYEYRCDKCLHELEAFQAISAEPLSLCPSCSSDQLKRKVGGGASLLRFEGTGYYETDYKKDCSCGKGKC